MMKMISKLHKWKIKLKRKKQKKFRILSGVDHFLEFMIDMEVERVILKLIGKRMDLVMTLAYLMLANIS